jgi:hypothetical protein
LPAPVVLPNVEQRSRLGVLADEWIPAGDGMPSATEAGATGKHLDRVLRARPDLASQLVGALAGDAPLNDDRVIAVRYAVTAAYYLAPAVRAALHYDPEVVNPVRALDFPEYIEEGLLDHLIDASS